MPETFQALFVLMLAALPGFAFERGLERQLPFLRTEWRERAPRFVAWSSMFHILVAPLTIVCVNTFVRIQGVVLDEKARATARAIREAGPVWVVWPALLVYLVVPYALGTVVGSGARKKGIRGSVARVFAGKNPEPLAWDDLFVGSRNGYVRVRLKSGEWYAGSVLYASCYPDRQDLTLEGVAVDSAGSIVISDGSVVMTNWQIHVARDECEVLQFQPF